MARTIDHKAEAENYYLQKIKSANRQLSRAHAALATAQQFRDRRILDAVDHGVSQAAVARALGKSRQWVHYFVRAGAAVPRPIFPTEPKLFPEQ